MCALATPAKWKTCVIVASSISGKIWDIFDENSGTEVNLLWIPKKKKIIFLILLRCSLFDTNLVTTFHFSSWLLLLLVVSKNTHDDTGLTQLTKLKDLSLFNNCIENIEGLQTLTQLEVLSLGNNKITELDNIKELRSFRQLRMLCLDDNPVVHEPGASAFFFFFFFFFCRLLTYSFFSFFFFEHVVCLFFF